MIATPKCTLTDGGHGAGDSHRGQADAFFERTEADGGNTFGDGNRGRAEHPLNAAPSIFFSLSGKVMEVRALQSRKAHPLMEVKPLPRVTVVRASHHAKTWSPMDFTLLGMAMEVSELHSWNARAPMEVTPSGMTTEVRPLHFKKAV